jgi:transposase
MIIMDNLGIHRSRNIKNLMDELGFHYAYTPVASPMYNGVEEVINMGKQNIKKRRLEAIVSGEQL